MENGPADLSVISYICEVRGKIVNITPLRIGGGTADPLNALSDNPILTIGGKPYIPGSTLKGVLRSIAESYALSVGETVIYPYDDVQEEEYDKCLTCQIFGSQSSASRVFVRDAYVIGNYSLGLRTSVSIDSDTGSQSHGRLFTLDFVEPGAVFDFMAKIYNINLFHPNSEWEKKASDVLGYALTQFKEGVSLGSRKSVGFGEVRLEGAKETLKKLEGGKLIVKEERAL
ncbi:RAMP superfamily CRISPR-associated protein [Tardisphaera miroshnichenkoae]